MNKKKVISPCISICKTDYNTGFCYGCSRTAEEKITWKDEKTNNTWKEKNIDELIKRMTGWQLESFKESYEHKIKTGISIYKKNQIKK